MGLSHQIIGRKNMKRRTFSDRLTRFEFFGTFLYQAHNAIAIMGVDITGSTVFQRNNASYSEKASKLLFKKEST